MRSHRGFTLLEVLVALVIVAFGMGALMATLTSAATSVERLRDKSFAEWVALNRISEVRLGRAAPTKGKTTGETEMGGQKWQWTQEIAEANFPLLMRIDVHVSRKSANASEPAVEFASAEGFFGLGGTLANNTGTYTDADWSLTTLKANPPGGPPPPGAPNGAPGNTGTPPTTPPATPPPAPSTPPEPVRPSIGNPASRQ